MVALTLEVLDAVILIYEAPCAAALFYNVLTVEVQDFEALDVEPSAAETLD